MIEKKIQNALDKINLLSKKMGLDEKQEKTILNLEDTNDSGKKLLTLQSGDWNDKEPWFVIDQEGKIHTMISLDTLLYIINALRVAQEENFNLKLEKSIWQNVPIDFQDVWVVAMDEIKKQLKNSQDKKSLNIDIDKVVKDVKKKYPNLFLNLDRYLSGINQEEMV